MNRPTELIDPAHFRTVLADVPTSVVVVTAVVDGQPIGMTLGSFVSVSLDPPLVGFCADDSSTTWPRLRDAGAPFCINVLAADQQDLCQRFARSGEDKFHGVAWEPSPLGSPILTGVTAWLTCTLEAVHRAGDHEIAIGRVHALEQARNTRPLVFWHRALGTVNPEGYGS